MDFLDAKYPDYPLYSRDPFLRAEQDLMISTFVDLEKLLAIALLSRGKDKAAMIKLV